MRLSLIIIFMVSAILLRAQDTRVFVFLNSKADKEIISEAETAELMKLHLANIEKMVVDGKLLVAGPFEGGGGIFVFNTADVALTKEWLQADPAVKANRWNIEVFQVDFDKGGACLAQEPYEMVTYNFMRVNFINDIANYKMNKTDIQGWQEASRADSVLAVGRFPQYDGGFIIYKGEQASWQGAFSEDQVALEKRGLWVAKGSFCE